MNPPTRAQSSNGRLVALLIVALGAGSLGVGFLLARTGRFDGTPTSPRDVQPATSTGRSGRGESPPRKWTRARPEVPKLNLQETSAVELVPGRPGYDPVALAPFVPPEQVFAGEAKNPAWADSVERALLQYDKRAAAGVLPGFAVKRAECRSTMCRLEWTAPEETAPMVSEVIRHLFPGALMKCKRNGEYYVGFVGGSGRYKNMVSGDPEATIAAMARDRRERAETIIFRGGRGLHLPPEVVAAWPRGE